MKPAGIGDIKIGNTSDKLSEKKLSHEQEIVVCLLKIKLHVLISCRARVFARNFPDSREICLLQPKKEFIISIKTVIFKERQFEAITDTRRTKIISISNLQCQRCAKYMN